MMRAEFGRYQWTWRFGCGALALEAQHPARPALVAGKGRGVAQRASASSGYFALHPVRSARQMRMRLLWCGLFCLLLIILKTD
jgi:hypothetical protein